MNTAELIALDSVATTPLSKIEQADPALHKQLAARVRADHRERIAGVFAGASAELRAAVGNVDLDPAVADVAAVQKAVLDGLAAQKVDPAVATEAIRRLGDLEAAGGLDLAAADLSPADNPLFQADLQAALVARLAVGAGLAEPKADGVLVQASVPGEIDGERLASLVKDGVIDDTEAQSLGLAATLYNLLDERVDESGALAAVLRDGGVKQPGDLATLDRDAWAASLKKAKVRPPAGMDAGDLAQHLRDVAASIEPSRAMRATTALPAPKAMSAQITRIGGLLDANPDAFGRPFDELDAKAIPVADLDATRTAFEAVSALVNLHPGLRLAEVVAGHGTSAEKAKAMTERVALVDAVAAANPDVELLAVDFSPDSPDLAAIDFAGLDADQQGMVIADLKAHQRMYLAMGTPDLAKQFLAGGYASEVALAIDDVASIMAKAKVPESTARAAHAKAETTLSTVSTTLISMVDLVKGGFEGLQVANQGPSINDYLRKLEGFSDLFGSQDACQCEHCQSILGPSAYFVDLMGFIEEHILKDFFSGARANHLLSLKVRRGDLWTTELTCANTDTLIPTLDIINEILENYIARLRGYAGDLRVRSLVEDTVYSQALAGSTDSFRQPFVLPVAKLDAYLGHFELSRADVARTLEAPAAVVTAATFRLSPRGYELVTQPNTAIGFLRGVYGVQFNAAAGGVIDPIDVQDLLRFTHLTRDELGELAATAYVTSNGARPIEIRGEKRTADSVQNDIERARGLRVESLDRLHRLARLHANASWSIPELDLLLAQLASAGLGADLAAATPNLAMVAGLGQRFARPAEQLAALFGPIPRTVLPGKMRSLFDRLFNLPPFERLDGVLPKDAVSFVHPTFRSAGVPNPADTTLHRLNAGLQVNDEQLAALITRLAAPLGANLAAPAEDDRGFLLTAANLSLLYRHALLGKLLRLTIPELFQSIAQAGIAGGQLVSLGDVQTLLGFHDWRRGSGFSLDDLARVTGGEVARPAPFDAGAIAVEIVGRIATERSLEFADTLFAFLPGVTEDVSRSVVRANLAPAGGIEPTPDGAAFRLRSTFDPGAPLVMPAGVAIPDADAKEVLLSAHASRVLAQRLAARFGMPVEKMSRLVTMTGVSLAGAPIVEALQGGPLAPLTDLVAKLRPLTIAFRAPAFDADALDFVVAHRAIFDAGDLNALTIPALRKLGVYAALAAPTGDDDEDAPPVDPSAVRDALESFQAANGFAATPTSRLAAALRVPESLVLTVLPNVTLPATAPEALTKVDRVVRLASAIGVAGDTLKLMLSANYADLARAGEATLGAIRAQFGDEAEFASRLEPREEEVRSAKRDGLVDYLIRSVHPEFDDVRELYEYFLVDTELEGCAKTSRLVAAISSAQLYVHRVLMNLEQDRRDPTDPQHVHVQVPADAAWVDEWTWRKNYRVWEANRKVFLWPENYVEPELRDNKTPLFGTLESTLLQQRIDEQNVLDAFSDYMTGLDELSRLKIAGSYHDRNDAAGVDVLHLFGVATGDPPAYYHRTIENAYHGEVDAGRAVVWGPWRKVEVQIPVRKVTPIVYLGRLFVFWTEVVTSPENKVIDGNSTFAGYKHKLGLRYTSLRLDGTWTPPQPIALLGGPFGGSDGVVPDPLATDAEQQALEQALAELRFTDAWALVRQMTMPAYDDKPHPEPLDGYTLSGFQWDQVYPEIYASALKVTGRNFTVRAGIDFYRRQVTSVSPVWYIHSSGLDRLLCARGEPGARVLYSAPTSWFAIPDYAQASIIADDRRIAALKQVPESTSVGAYLGLNLYQQQLARMAPATEVSVINGSLTDAILDADGDLLLLQGSVRPGPEYLLKRIGTTLGERLSRILFTGGVDTLLAIGTQKTLGESLLPLATVGHIERKTNEGKLDFKGPYGTYFREVFFHIPFLIANHLNSQQSFAAAQDWYHYIFDPTATETIPVPAGASAAERARKQRDRVWRYLEFRDLTVPKLRDVLTDPATIEVYKKDPFNPHAIARLRLSGYQKAIVMKYVDNLLDWGDSLFAQFTMESVNEATMLYVMASDILGRRPATLGSCGEGAVVPRDYEHIAPLVQRGSEFLVELESWLVTKTPAANRMTLKRKDVGLVADTATTSYFRRLVLDDELRRQAAIEDPKARVAEASMAPLLAFEPVAPAPAPAPGPAAGPGPAPAPGAGVLAGRLPARTPIEAIAHDLGMVRAAGGPGGALAAGVMPLGTGLNSGMIAAAVVDDNRTAMGAMRAFSARDDVALAGTAQVDDPIVHAFDWRSTKTTSWVTDGDRITRYIGNDTPLIKDYKRVPRFAWSIIRQVSPAFCVPQNKDLLAYWERLEDRLYKIHHCLDINGIRRDLAPFAPEIDPRLLVRARAAGLSIEDVLQSTSGDLPPYRFAYLIDKAKQHVAVVQGFGAALLAALEKRDIEELGRLRTTHQQNLLRMSTRMREREVAIAEAGIETVRRQQQVTEYRRDYYLSLLQTDLTPWERTQQVSRHSAGASVLASMLLRGAAGILTLLPQLGSPFAMKYGGQELGTSADRWAKVFSDTASLAEIVAASAGLEAGFERRREGWDHQAELAKHELKQLDRQLAAAELRRDIAQRALEIHQKDMAQLDEVATFMAERFSNLGLYTWLSTTLQRLYRDAYDSAYAMARLAEQAYRFERSDDTSPLLGADYWDATHAGLLAGERLLIDLEAMDRRFMETNYRLQEVDQSFSLTQVAPEALLTLREIGTCEFELPEVFFDLAYPGHYRRRVKSVRLTIPCVTGPYANVGAVLSLTGSKIRNQPARGAAHLVDVPLRRSVSVATSTAQNDAGVFEFSFRDERYMPFEGSGAVSSWRIELPRNFRQFDYQTITDVILHVSYTAELDGAFRGDVEELNATIEGTLLNWLSDNRLERAISVRQDFGGSFSRLLHSAPKTNVPLTVDERFLPIFIRGRNIQLSSAKLVLRTPPGQTVAGVELCLNGEPISGFTRDPELGGLWSADAMAALATGILGDHVLAVETPGDLAPDSPVAGDPSAVDEAKLGDVVLDLEYQLA